MTSNGSNSSLSSPAPSKWPAIDAIDLYVTPVWYVIGIPGNILAFIVWVQRRMRPSSGCYLAALALDECLFLIMQVCCCRVVSSCKRPVPPPGSETYRIDPLRFLAGYRQRRLNQALSVLSLSLMSVFCGFQ